MDKKIKIEFIDKPIFKIEADKFREEYWDDTLPVDIEKIIEAIGIDIIPIPEMFRLLKIDALITSDWSAIYVDNESYMGDYQNRMRFSLAHEMGHLFLHKDIYASFGIRTEEDFYEFYKVIPENKYGMMEKQADMFANNLLVPREKLKIFLEEERKNLEEMFKKEGFDIEKLDKTLINSYLSKPIAKIFGVSENVADIAISNP